MSLIIYLYNYKKKKITGSRILINVTGQCNLNLKKFFCWLSTTFFKHKVIVLSFNFFVFTSVRDDPCFHLGFNIWKSPCKII